MQFSEFRSKGNLVILPALFSMLAILAAVSVLRSTLGADGQREISLGEARPAYLYGLSVSLKDPAQLHGQDSIHVAVSDASGILAEKWLHTADLDFYVLCDHARSVPPR
jgi:hypothetical protein